MKFDILNKITGAVQFTADIDCSNGALKSVKIGLAVRWGLKNGADLYGANLSSADLSSADLSSADLRSANLSSADLSSANLYGAKNLGYQIPQEGELIVYKKLREDRIAKLRVPPEAKRTASIVGRKCRAEFVTVMAIYNGTEEIKTGTDTHTGLLTYKVGEEIRPDSYDDDPRVECTHGIHFFLSREEAETYN